MAYKKLPPQTVLSSEQFVDEMNKALTTLDFYQEGMVVCADENGYWLELKGVRDVDNLDLLSLAERLVLSRD